MKSAWAAVFSPHQLMRIGAAAIGVFDSGHQGDGRPRFSILIRERGCGWGPSIRPRKPLELSIGRPSSFVGLVPSLIFHSLSIADHSLLEEQTQTEMRPGGLPLLGSNRESPGEMPYGGDVWEAIRREEFQNWVRANHNEYAIAALSSKRQSGNN